MCVCARLHTLYFLFTLLMQCLVRSLLDWDWLGKGMGCSHGDELYMLFKYFTPFSRKKYLQIYIFTRPHVFPFNARPTEDDRFNTRYVPNSFLNDNPII